MQKILIISLLLVGFTSTAQNRIGYLISNTGDTLRGEFINPKDVNSSVEFRKQGQKAFTTYSPSNAKSFLIEGEGNYFSKTVTLAGRWYDTRTGGVEAANQKANINTITEPITISKFLRRHRKGAISLYSFFSNDYGEVYFFENANGIQMLNNKQGDEIKQLFFSDNNSPKLQDKLTKAPQIYTLTYLSSLLDLYAIETGAKQSQDIKSASQKLLGIKIGGNINNFAFVDTPKEYTNANFTYSYSPVVGIYFNIGKGRRFSLQPEIQYVQRGAKSAIAGIFNSGEGKNFKYRSQAIEASINYKVNLSKNTQKTPYILFGVLGGRVFGDEVTQELYQINFKNNTTGLFDFGGQVGIGLKLNRLSAEIRGNHVVSNTIFYLAGYSGIKMQSAQFSVNYDLIQSR
jgi:hypothetical protein